ncbi:unnamed protein product (macronuclear) [Paramecium tetraurelia]|uniref:Mitochondrial import inner membrane translocase subunit n=1 Tax=Paramecium tetraurelia TaxID=5888 RepID=A0C4S0_PARTE|nr:uncharacterized protein GSPATT00006286001 [Paramecium tetraurelia]CAK65787.1 unnamed protein product [Paramecium tetraurelia]|eukprot:XP_001433184.1 hypothetical protein (macronuclear) [Paramecium tetraurelia strain d4-2]
MSDDSESLDFPNTPLYTFNITVGLTLSLTKLCANKCRLFKPDQGTKLSENDVQCVKNCAATINNNYQAFTSSLKEAINFEDSFGVFEPEE